MKSMLVIVPSRGRPENIKRLIDGIERTRFDKTTELLVAVDDDDPTLDAYVTIGAAAPSWVALRIGKRLRLGGTLNDLAPKFAADYGVLGFMGDDHLPRTQGWDRRIFESMQRGGVVYGNDLFQREILPTAVFFDSRVVQSLGYFVPPGLVHLFFDNAWKDWGQASGKLVYLDDVIIEHLHPHAGKAEMDDRYTEVNSAETWGPDELRYNEYKANGEFASDIAKLRAL